jgi:hypothetical protein
MPRMGKYIPVIQINTVNEVDLAVDRTIIILLPSKLIYSGFLLLTNYINRQILFPGPLLMSSRTNLLYKTTLTAHFVLLFGQHVALFESRHKHEYSP